MRIVLVSCVAYFLVVYNGSAGDIIGLQLPNISSTQNVMRNGCIECKRVTKLTFHQNISGPRKLLLDRFLFLLNFYYDNYSNHIVSLRRTCLNPAQTVLKRRIFIRDSESKNIPKHSWKLKQTPSYSLFGFSNQIWQRLRGLFKNIFKRSEVCLQCSRHDLVFSNIPNELSSLEQFLLIVLGPTTQRNLKGNICQLRKFERAGRKHVRLIIHRNKPSNQKNSVTKTLPNTTSSNFTNMNNSHQFHVMTENPAWIMSMYNIIFPSAEQAQVDNHTQYEQWFKRFTLHLKLFCFPKKLANKEPLINTNNLAALVKSRIVRNKNTTPEKNSTFTDSSTSVTPPVLVMQKNPMVANVSVPVFKEAGYWWQQFVLLSHGKCPIVQKAKTRSKKPANLTDLPSTGEKKDGWITSMYNIVFAKTETPTISNMSAHIDETVIGTNVSKSGLNWWRLVPMLSKQKCSKKINSVAINKRKERPIPVFKDFSSWCYWFATILQTDTCPLLQPSQLITIDPNTDRFYERWFRRFILLMRLKSPNPRFSSSVTDGSCGNLTEIVSTHNKQIDVVWYSWFVQVLRLQSVNPNAPTKSMDLVGYNEIERSKPNISLTLVRRILTRAFRNRPYRGEVTDSSWLLIVISSMIVYMLRGLRFENTPKVLPMDEEVSEPSPTANPGLTPPPPQPLPSKSFEMEWIIAVVEISPFPHADPNMIF